MGACEFINPYLPPGDEGWDDYVASDTPNLDRRGFLKGIAAVGALSLCGGAVAEPSYWDEPRVLKLFRPATNEQVAISYWENGTWNLPGYVQICQLLRDNHQNKAVQMDRTVLDTLRGITWWLAQYGYNDHLYINSAYRTPETNARLVVSEGAAKNSLHMLGRAVDITVPGITPELLARMGLYFKAGVGLYDSKKFIHVDSGWPRFWRKR